MSSQENIQVQLYLVYRVKMERAVVLVVVVKVMGFRKG